MQYATNMLAKVLCFLLVVVSASAATLSQPDPKRGGDALLSATSERLTRSTTTGSSPSVERSTVANHDSLNDPLLNLTVLANVDFSQLNQSMLMIPDLPNINSLPPIPGLKEATENARNLVLHMLNSGGDLQSALINSTLNAIRGLNPVVSLTNMISNILRIYNDIARSNPFYMVTVFVIREGLRVAASIANAVMGLLPNST